MLTSDKPSVDIMIVRTDISMCGRILLIPSPRSTGSAAFRGKNRRSRILLPHSIPQWMVVIDADQFKAIMEGKDVPSSGDESEASPQLLNTTVTAESEDIPH